MRGANVLMLWSGLLPALGSACGSTLPHVRDPKLATSHALQVQTWKCREGANHAHAGVATHVVPVAAGTYGQSRFAAPPRRDTPAGACAHVLRVCTATIHGPRSGGRSGGAG